jgi:bifunctional UDP-N-acetylglucosamine pyrophosphorylase/glucosamine-1-phosphate N-acetyltransferase
VVAPQDIFAIIGYQAERVRSAVQDTGVQFVVQEPQRGTGHAIISARGALAGYDHVIVLSGDAPLITPATIAKLRDFHLQHKPAMTILSTELQDPTGYGRLLLQNQRRSQKPLSRKILHSHATQAMRDQFGFTPSPSASVRAWKT